MRAETVEVDSAIAGDAGWLEPSHGAELAAHPLSCIETEYPHFVFSVDTEGYDEPRETHPVFYGCFDWHSAVHSHWCLCRQLRLIENHPKEQEIRTAIDALVSPEAVAGEVETFEQRPTFENPYGWGWFLRLMAELSLWDDAQATLWRETFAPLERFLVGQVETEFLQQPRPQRVGTHHNSAFSLAAVLDYAQVVGNDELAATATERARSWFLDDTEYPIRYEPLGADFVSPALTEADLMGRILERPAFTDWFASFLPSVATGEGLPEPVAVSEEPDGQELHLVGLNLSRAWCLAATAQRLDDHASPQLTEAARAHAAAGLDRAFTDDYAGAHWLSSFVLYLCSHNAGAIAPGTE